MPNRNVSLTEHQDRFVDHAVASGRYQSASEVLREALRLLERRESTDEAKLARLRNAVSEAEAALARGEYEDISGDQLDDWLSGLGLTARE